MQICLRVFAFGFLLLSAVSSVADMGDRVTILYDAFGERPSMKKDWGFAALIEYRGKRILFDTGNDARTFADNVDAAGVDLRKLDFVVISHRHLDHTAGLSHLLAVNPGVTIYAPKEAFGAFGSSLPSGFYRKDESLPEPMRYYGGHPPDTMRFGTVWVGAHFELVEKTFEVVPGITIIALVSEAPGTKELRELSLVLHTPEGSVLMVGCSHPGIDRIVEAAVAIDGHVHVIFGGFHLPTASDEQISRVAGALRETFRVDRLAPGHCTGEPAFAALRRMWGDRYLYAGVGSVIEIP
ncbi:MAG TPA: MBL fold metallo-hydrolase [Burkholderiales bacterium]|jgi:7,8-dihydropterin-6-yl-methyl-4-(beta-D-ribofuranosyl)aminobenzene 5'-phosphate synthase|nr:MBL fold metallo-hydrolase [Burkholderiales bacterium]